MKAVVFAVLFGFVLAQISALPAPEVDIDQLEKEDEANNELERSKQVYGGYAAKAPAKAPASVYGAPAPTYAAPAPAYGAAAYGAPAYGAPAKAQAPTYGAPAPAYAAPAKAQAPVYAAPAQNYAAPAYGAQAYAAPAPAKAPAYQGSPVVYSYQAPAPTVPCAKNVLVGCAPSWTSVPCGSAPAPAYGAPAY